MSRHVTALAALLACLPIAAPAGVEGRTVAPRHRPAELIEHPDRWLGTDVYVEIVESLEGPATMEQLARAEYGQVRVRVPEAPATSLSLVPAEFRLDDPDRYRKRFDRVLRSPLLVHADLLEDPELRRGARRSLVLRVRSIETLPQPEPVRVSGIAELLADPRRFDRSVIEIEGMHVSRFEVSALDSKIWLERAPDARVVGTATAGWGARRVRVIGTLFSKPDAHYGHLGSYPLLLVAREIEYR
jgi:hypothetical protein